MEFVKGLVVHSKAGHDKGGFFAVLTVNDDTAVICDGKRRSLEHPKVKKQKHLGATRTVLGEDSMKTNRQIRAALRAFCAQERPAEEEACICRNRT